MQVIVQAINAITGLLLVRYLDKENYAWFTIASSLLATLNVLGDGGLSAGLTALGGPLFNHPQQFAGLIHDAFRLAVRLIIAAIIISTSVFYFLFTNVSTPVDTTIIALALAACAVSPSVSSLLLIAVQRLRTKIQDIQIAEITGSCTRLILTGLVLLSGNARIIPALGATVISAWVTSSILHHQTREIRKSHNSRPSHKVDLIKFVCSLYPNHIFFCLQAQISTWIISLFGSSNEVADLGALSRLGIIITFTTAPFYYLVVPSIARIQDLRYLKKQLILALTAAVLPCIAIIVSSMVFPQVFLWALGSTYYHLGSELPILFLSNSVQFLSSLIWSLLIARRWISRPWLTIPFSLLGFIIGAATLKLSTISGILWFNVIAHLPPFLFVAILTLIKLQKNQIAKI